MGKVPADCGFPARMEDEQGREAIKVEGIMTDL